MTTTTTMLRAKLIDSETGGPNRSRPWGVNHSAAALSRALVGLSHDIVSRTTAVANRTRRVGAPRASSRIPERKRRPLGARGEREREREREREGGGNGLPGRFAVSTSATERQKVRPLSNDLSVFVSRLIYE